MLRALSFSLGWPAWYGPAAVPHLAQGRLRTPVSVCEPLLALANPRKTHDCDPKTAVCIRFGRLRRKATGVRTPEIHLPAVCAIEVLASAPPGFRPQRKKTR